jgi:hypothetical protein
LATKCPEVVPPGGTPVLFTERALISVSGTTYVHLVAMAVTSLEGKKMTSYKIRAKSLVAGSLLGAGSLLAACGGSPAAPPATTTTTAAPTTHTVTTSVAYACAGQGPIIGPGGSSPVGPIANQNISVAVTMPNSGTVGGSLAVSVDLGTFNLAPAPLFVNLNLSGIPAVIDVAGANAAASVNADGAWIGNGAQVNVPPAGTTRTGTAGANTVTVGTITLISGSTGFICTLVTPGTGAQNTTTI